MRKYATGHPITLAMTVSHRKLRVSNRMIFALSSAEYLANADLFGALLYGKRDQSEHSQATDKNGQRGKNAAHLLQRYL